MAAKPQKKNKKKPVKLNLPCPFGGNPDLIDYKDTHRLKKFITTRGRLVSPTKTGVSAKCQRKLSVSVKRARYMALLPYVNYV